MIESTECSSTIVYTDHSTAVSIFRQITLIIFSTDKLNLRLIRASQYLFSFNLSIRHKSDKFNIVSNALSRLQVSRTIDEKIDVLKSLHVSIESSNQYEVAYHVTLMKMSNDFKSGLKEVYVGDKQ